MIEFWDAYDETRNQLDHKLIRGNPIPKGEYHLVVNIFIITENGDILVTQRHPDKPFALLWECTGGSVTSGEDSVTGAIREVEEEIGLTLPAEKFKLVKSERRYNDFLDTYLVITNIDLTKLKLQDEEVIDAKLVSYEEYKNMHKQGFLVPSLDYFYEIYESRE